MIESSKSNIRCYISAPVGVDTAVIRSILRSLSVEIDREEETPPPGGSSVGSIRESLKSVDFVCGVISSLAPAANVLFELGLAAGLGRPIFVIVDNIDLAPLGLLSYPHVKTSIQDSEALRYHVKLFLPNIQKSARAALTNPIRKKIRVRDNAPLHMPPNQEAEAQDTLSLLTSAMRQAGLEVVSEKSFVGFDQAFKPDLVAWLPDTSIDLGNPILFELKTTQPPANISDWIYAVRRYLKVSGLRTGVLVVNDGQILPNAQLGDGGYIFVLQLRDLLNAIQNGRLAQILLELRNRLIHGKS